MRLVPQQAHDIAVAAVGPVLPDAVAQIRLRDLVTMGRSGPDGHRVWHARRNIEMLAGLALKHLLRKRLKLMFTSAAQRHHTGYTKWLIRKMDRPVATSALSAGYLDHPAQVIHHGIDTETFTPAGDKSALRVQLGLDPDAILLGCFGRIRPSKGTDIFVDAVCRVLPDHPRAQGIIMGGVTEKFEGFGLTPLEAMACGVPCIATGVGAFAEIVADGLTGQLIAKEDEGALVDAIDGALQDPRTIPDWAAACRP